MTTTPKRPRGMPLFSKVVGDEIEIEMVLPSGQLGLRSVGHRVLVAITPELRVEVRSPSSGRVIACGAVNLETMSWFDVYSTPEEGRELCETALQMIDARVETTCKLFRRGWLDSRWLSVRARLEVGL